jgi:EAL domain-containing protein (putative c-di-GMP-specific phosphodiesterase class I)
MDEACAQLAQWRRQGLEPPTLAVNLSPLQLQEGVTPLSQWLQPILETHSIRPGDLELEITESCLLPESGIHVDGELERLRALGVSLAIDDFGTGYSSLQVLHRLPVQALKIDRSFVDNLEQDHSLQTIVRTILLLAQGLGLRTLAEGVETEFQVRMFTALGCSAFQGYHFSRPLDATATTALLQRRFESAAAEHS